MTKTNKKRGFCLFFYFQSALNLSTIYRKILKFRVEGADSGFLPSPTRPSSFFAVLIFGLVAKLLFRIGIDELPSLADGIISELDFSTGLIMSVSTFPMFSWAKETSEKRQKPRTATLKMVVFLKLNGTEYDIINFGDLCLNLG
jgi:hypothetical protein